MCSLRNNHAQLNLSFPPLKPLGRDIFRNGTYVDYNAIITQFGLMESDLCPQIIDASANTAVWICVPSEKHQTNDSR
jgi:hypothetical protein